MSGVGKGAPKQSQLIRRAGELIELISEMETQHPLKPVWGGLPRSDPEGHIIDEPPSYDNEELQILALREPLSQLLRDAQRYVNDFGTPEHKQRFRDNTLVRVAVFNGAPGRRGYAKTDCLADLQSLRLLLQRIGADHSKVSHRPFSGGEISHVQLQEATDAGRVPEGPASEPGVEQHYSVKELSELWGLSERTVRRLIEDEPGAIRIHKNSRLKRTYRRVQIPASVAKRIYRKITRR